MKFAFIFLKALFLVVWSNIRKQKEQQVIFLKVFYGDPYTPMPVLCTGTFSAQMPGAEVC